MILNIVGLQISVPEFIWTIISFFVFLFLLKIFLYDPVIKFMDGRRARIDAGLEEGKKAQKAMAENAESLKTALTETGGEAREIISDARAEAEKAKGEVLAGAHSEAEKIHRDVRERIGDEEKAAGAAVSGEMPELVAVLAERLLRSDEASKNRELIRSCVEASKE